MTRVCLVTTGQPSTNPRLVKEADALASAGYCVHVVGAHWADWADEQDRALLAARRWTTKILDWRRDRQPGVFWKTRLRYAAARAVEPLPGFRGIARLAAAGRMSPELARAAAAWPADLYIAHNLGALPAAAAAARRHGAALGFDAEDFHRGQLSDRDGRDRARAHRIESHFMPRCTYVSASSPGIAEAYADLCAHPPVVLLNVFPMSHRPAQLAPRAAGPLRAYWFSQTIGRDRGLETAVRALGLLRETAIELHLRGAWQPGFEAELMRVAADAGVETHRIIHHAPAASDAMVDLASRYDVGLALEPGHTTNSDLALSNKIFTYLLGGVPVVASATSAQAALGMQLGAAARVVPAEDPAALAAALRAWAGNPESLTVARQTAWQLGEARFNWDREERRFLQVVRQALRAAAPAVQPAPAVGEFVS